MADTTTTTLPALAADTLGETITLTHFTKHAERVTALAGHLCYGHSYRRGVLENLRDMSRFAGWGDLEAATLMLERAEHCAS